LVAISAAVAGSTISNRGSAMLRDEDLESCSETRAQGDHDLGGME
jgi:hypothetical protein